MFLLIFTDYEWFIYVVACKNELLAGPCKMLLLVICLLITISSRLA